MNLDLPKLSEAAQARVEACRSCENYLLSKALNLQLEKCRLCGCFIHMKAALGAGNCPAGKW